MTVHGPLMNKLVKAILCHIIFRVDHVFRNARCQSGCITKMSQCGPTPEFVDKNMVVKIRRLLVLNKVI